MLAAELVFLPKLLDKKNRPLSFKPFSTYPTSKKDICIILDKTIPCHIVQNDLEQIGRKVCEGFFLKNVRIFDIFEGPGLPSGKKSLAFELEFSADSQTLTDVHVNNAFNSIQDHIDSIDKYQVRR